MPCATIYILQKVGKQESLTIFIWAFPPFFSVFSFSIFLSIFLSLYLSIYLSIYISIYLSVYLTIYLSSSFSPFFLLSYIIPFKFQCLNFQLSIFVSFFFFIPALFLFLPFLNLLLVAYWFENVQCTTAKSNSRL